MTTPRHSTHRTDTSRAPAPDCRTAVERMPWLLNGSLGDDEQEALLDHVSTCESCLAELEETALVWEMVTEHVPSLALAQYAEGLPLTDLDPADLERHLEICPSCREELALATADRVVAFDAERVRRATPAPRQVARSRRAIHWRRWAAAAAIALAVTSATFFAAFDSPTSTISQEPAGTEIDGSSSLFGDSFESGNLNSWSSSS